MVLERSKDAKESLHRVEGSPLFNLAAELLHHYACHLRQGAHHTTIGKLGHITLRATICATISGQYRNLPRAPPIDPQQPKKTRLSGQTMVEKLELSP
ncbi:hypothetical protein LY76DRAFT_242677 [Colletotrichum caudatum]|nr:hypothetical protein LY76DRAFT_242677 [Colletotrichum caudatum]